MLYARLSATKLTKEPGPILDILRNHLVETTDVSVGEKVLGKAIMEPRWNSISSLARSEHVHALTLRKILIARKVVPADAEDRPCSATLIDYRTGRDIAAAMNRAVPFTALPAMMQASRPVVKVLIESGLLPALRDDGVKHGKVSCAVDRNHVETLFKRLFEIAPTVTSAPHGMYDLAKSAEMSHLKLDLILPAVFRGHLKRVCRLDSKRGFEALLVDPAEIQEKEFEFQPGISLEMAFEMIGVGIDVGRKLISDQAQKPLIRVSRPFGQTEFCVDPSSLKVFLERWVTVPILRKETGLEEMQIQGALLTAQVKPAFEKETMGIDIYRRLDVGDMFAS